MTTRVVRTEMRVEYDTMTPEELRKIRQFALKLIIAALILMPLFYFLIGSQFISLHPSDASSQLEDFAGRLRYAFIYQTPLVAWLMFMVCYTIYARFKAQALNPLNDLTEQRVLGSKNILTNSVESFVISVAAQYIFVALASRTAVMIYIPAFNLVLFIGRICFFLGYPMKRSFGMSLTLGTNIGIMLYNIVLFVRYILAI